MDEETTIIDERKGNAAGGRDSKPVVKDNNPPSPNAPPKCQGCIIRPAQFVCAGCGNQWYCSRTCQVELTSFSSFHTCVYLVVKLKLLSRRHMCQNESCDNLCRK